MMYQQGMDYVNVTPLELGDCYFMQNCALEVIQRKRKAWGIKGYFVIPDDVAFYHWLSIDLSRFRYFNNEKKSAAWWPCYFPRNWKHYRNLRGNGAIWKIIAF